MKMRKIIDWSLRLLDDLLERIASISSSCSGSFVRSSAVSFHVRATRRTQGGDFGDRIVT